MPCSTHYLDDYLVMGCTNNWSCSNLLKIFKEWAAELGVLSAKNNTEGLIPIPIIFGDAGEDNENELQISLVRSKLSVDYP